ncbi:hypothetical protein PACTADRAFT_46996 [Pachysolen tannophilus NRRL Y-2460]|uniref:Vacuolar protein sorting-associated protein 55 n=1 Tax=Pachysolen tannophilus NRRL Y-2460 TaxID=669874 RepID=A0A1E4TP16_PACTA|nr:hypothetical protein PACTADRAFT_46996 [Pachysolen tannophilus NRRL Y-2460]
MQVSPITKIIGLSIVLAIGFLLIILSCALYSNWTPLFDVVIFLIAPIPNSLSKSIQNHYDDFMSDSDSRSPGTFAMFSTGFLVLSGLELPLVLYHAELICLEATVMSSIGGLLIYATIITFGWYFNEDDDDDDAFGF